MSKSNFRRVGNRTYSHGMGWQEDVVTYQSTTFPGRTQDLCRQHDTADNRLYNQVSHGLHLGRCALCPHHPDEPGPGGR